MYHPRATYDQTCLLTPSAVPGEDTVPDGAVASNTPPPPLLTCQTDTREKRKSCRVILKFPRVEVSEGPASMAGP